VERLYSGRAGCRSARRAATPASPREPKERQGRRPRAATSRQLGRVGADGDWMRIYTNGDIFNCSPKSEQPPLSAAPVDLGRRSLCFVLALCYGLSLCAASMDCVCWLRFVLSAACALHCCSESLTLDESPSFLASSFLASNHCLCLSASTCCSSMLLNRLSLSPSGHLLGCSCVCQTVPSLSDCLFLSFTLSLAPPVPRNSTQRLQMQTPATVQRRRISPNRSASDSS